MTERYLTRAGYRSREAPQYFHDTGTEIVYQPEVYREAGRLATALGASGLVDVGCGTARKLVALANRFQVTGIDFGANIERCRETWGDVGTWLEADLDAGLPLPIEPEQLDGAVLVCSDVIEHVTRPDLLLATLGSALETASALVISTPERDLTRTQLDSGPPKNPAHVREWNIREFGAMMRRAGFAHGSLGLTRSHDQSLRLNTILGVYTSTEENLSAAEEIFIDAEPPRPEEYAIRSRLAASRSATLEGLRHSWSNAKLRIKAETTGKVS